MIATKTINLGNLLLSISDAIDLANSAISQHQQRTAYIALRISKSASLPEEAAKNVFIASLLHDTGALSVEEKMTIHDLEQVSLKNNHCLRGELLLKRIPEFETIATIVKYHHTEWQAWDKPIDDYFVLTSQIILLADYIERLIDRDRYILHQTKDIIEKVKAISNVYVHPQIVDYFLAFAKKENFWLDLVSSRLYSLLFHFGPLKNVSIDYVKLENISEFFRDIIDFKSPFTATHTSGVAAAAEIISKIFGLSEREIMEMKIAGNVHDIGKLAIPNSILDKPDKLTKEEFDVIKSHTYYSYHIINSISGLKHIAEWAAFHHEKLNGSGYPFNYKGENIIIGSRIMAVADIFTALAEDRPYRKGMDKNGITKILGDMVANNALDAKLVSLLFDNYADINTYVKGIQESAQKFYDTRLKSI